MGYQYKPGDRVRVIDCFEEGHDYRMRYQDCGVIVKRTFKTREPFKGKIVTIAGYVFHRYIIEETSNNVLWTDEMFSGLAKPFSCQSLL